MASWDFLRIFEELLSLGVILSLDLFVVEKVLLYACVLVELEALLVEGEFLLTAADVMDCHVEWLDRSLVSLGLANICRSWRAAITRIFVIVQRGVNVM